MGKISGNIGEKYGVKCLSIIVKNYFITLLKQHLLPRILAVRNFSGIFFYLSAVKTALREIFAVDIFISSLLATVKYAKVYLTVVNTHETKVLRDCE